MDKPRVGNKITKDKASFSLATPVNDNNRYLSKHETDFHVNNLEHINRLIINCQIYNDKLETTVSQQSLSHQLYISYKEMYTMLQEYHRYYAKSKKTKFVRETYYNHRLRNRIDHIITELPKVLYTLCNTFLNGYGTSGLMKGGKSHKIESRRQTMFANNLTGQRHSLKDLQLAIKLRCKSDPSYKRMLNK